LSSNIGDLTGRQGGVVQPHIVNLTDERGNHYRVCPVIAFTCTRDAQPQLGDPGHIIDRIDVIVGNRVPVAGSLFTTIAARLIALAFLSQALA